MSRLLLFCASCLSFMLILLPVFAAEETTTAHWLVWLQNTGGQIITLNNEGKREYLDVMPDFTPHDRFIPTGEQVVIDHGSTLTVHDPILPGYFPFVTDIRLEFTGVYFVENGQKILVHLNRDDYMLMTRDGEQIPLTIDEDNIHMTINGFLRFDAEQQLVEYNTEAHTETIIWEGDGQSWIILGVELHPRTYGPFSQWQQVAPPVYLTPHRPIIAPTPLPTPDPIFKLGDTVRVQTIDGEVLYLRDDPLTGDIIFHLLGGMRVELIGGPVDAGVCRWWKVRTSDDLEGWAAQAVDDVTTLLPIG